MTKNQSLSAILFLSMVGVGFSGYLSYQELFKGQCTIGIIRCSTSFQTGIPACVIGLLMYLIIFGLSLLGLRSKK